MYKTSKRNKFSINDPNHRLEKTPNIRTIDEVLELIDTKNNSSNSYGLKRDDNYEEIAINDSPQIISDNNSKQKSGQNYKKSLSFSPNFSEEGFSQKLTTNSKKSYEKYSKKSKLKELSDDNKCNQKKSSKNIVIKGSKRVFQVVWGRYKPYKKHKEWNGDGFITINDNNCVHFYNTEGKSMGSSKGLKAGEDYEEGKRLIIGANEVELMDEVSVQEFESGQYFVEMD